MWKFIYWAIGVREKSGSITPNSMAKIPDDKYINYARINNTTISKEKSLKQRQQIETYYDKYNH